MKHPGQGTGPGHVASGPLGPDGMPRGDSRLQFIRAAVEQGRVRAQTRAASAAGAPSQTGPQPMRRVAQAGPGQGPQAAGGGARVAVTQVRRVPADQVAGVSASQNAANPHVARAARQAVAAGRTAQAAEARPQRQPTLGRPDVTEAERAQVARNVRSAMAAPVAPTERTAQAAQTKAAAAAPKQAALPPQPALRGGTAAPQVREQDARRAASPTPQPVMPQPASHAAPAPTRATQPSGVAHGASPAPKRRAMPAQPAVNTPEPGLAVTANGHAAAYDAAPVRAAAQAQSSMPFGAGAVPSEHLPIERTAEPRPDMALASAYRTGPDPSSSRRMSRVINVGAALLSLGFVAGLAYWGYGHVKRDIEGVPVVRALEGPIRVAPEDPGGQVTAHKGLAVNSVQSGGGAAAPSDRLILAPPAPGLTLEDVPHGELSSLPEPAPETPGLTDQLLLEAETTAGAATLTPAQEEATAAADAETAAPVVPVDPDGPVARALDLAESMTEGLAPLSGEPVDAEAGAAIPLAELPAGETDAGAEPAVVATPVVVGPGPTRSPRPAPRPRNIADAVAEVVANSVDLSASSSSGALPTDDVTELASVAAGTALVQLGAFDNAADARTAWGRISGLVDGLMDDKSRVIQQAEAGGRAFWRLRAAGFDDLQDARRFCAALVAESADCIPVIAR